MGKMTTDYARSIGVDPDRDRHTARGIYLTTADMRHIRTVLSAHIIRKGETTPEARWSQEIVRYISKLPGDPRP